MAGCCGGSSGVVITGSDNIWVTGSGTVSDPYVIHGDLQIVLEARDTPTVRLDLTGRGLVGDPFILTATATIKVNDLIDVVDSTPPSTGDTIIFDEATQTWRYEAPSPVAAGSIHAEGGIEGDGTLATPLKINVSNITDTSTTGAYTYIDANGELRAQFGGGGSGGSVAWDNVTGKPAAFKPERPLAADAVYNAASTSSPQQAFRIFMTPTLPALAVEGDIWFQTF